MEFNKFDSNRDGTIDINEIDNYINKNHKLSNPNFVKIKSAIFNGTHLIIQFDKKITNNGNSFKKCDSLNDCASNNTDIDLENLFTLKINGVDHTSNFIDTQINTFIGSTSYISKEGGGDTYFNVPDKYPTSNRKIKLLTVPEPSPTTQIEEDKIDLEKLSVNTELELLDSDNSNTGDFKLSGKYLNYSGINFQQTINDNKKVGTNNPNIEIINKNTLKIKLNESSTNNFIQKLNTSNDIKLYACKFNYYL